MIMIMIMVMMPKGYYKWSWIKYQYIATDGYYCY